MSDEAAIDGIARTAVNALNVAMRRLERTWELSAQVHFCLPDGRTDFTELRFKNFEEKRRDRAWVKAHALKGRALAIIFLSDAWVTQKTQKTPKEVAAGVPLPSEDPERQECLVVMLCTPKGVMGQQIPYERQGSRIVWGAPINMEPGTASCEWSPWG